MKIRETVKIPWGNRKMEVFLASFVPVSRIVISNGDYVILAGRGS